MSSSTLSPEQAHALFDILTHYQLYSEVEGFKWPTAIQNYGAPFSKEDPAQYSSPLMQKMFTSLIVTLPGITTLPPDFWQERVGTLIASLSEARLSESYDKGTMGTRKTLSTASSVLIENCARGCFGGCPTVEEKPKSQYDRSKAEDIKQAWERAAHELVYGDLIDELYDGIAKSDKLEDLSPLVQAAIEHILLITTSFVHHVFVLSPDGQYLLRLLSNVNKLVPYMAIKQTLRVGNAATMINGMLKLILTKLSVTAFTNWIGLSKNSDDGMNLMQQIISTVLTWDNSDFKDIASKIEKAKDGPSQEHLDAIETHIQAGREEHDKVRSISIEQSKSIVNVIFETAQYKPSTSLSDVQHAKALEYYSAKLSIRDRKELIRVLCHQYPDNLTQTIRDVVAVYDPLIRSIHNGVDLSAGLGDLQNFLEDMIKTIKPKSGNGNKAPSVEDFVTLFRTHLPSCLRFLHQVAKNCPEVSSTFRQWCKEAIQQFRKKQSSDAQETGGAGSMTAHLTTLCASVSEVQKPGIISALDAHSNYLSSLNKISMQRAQSVLDNKSTTMYGPGAYLARWHGLLDETLITPATPQGPVRRGKDIQFKDEEGKRKASGKGWWDSEQIAQQVMVEVPEQPNVDVVLELLGGPFRDLLNKDRSSGKTGVE
ncbi:uncharacterized protein LY89DRAFT_659304 [Mollisia scopiformis]|uniref:Px domain containing protein n=1 Tax=Mollisia scopiformis TaxID=149040 RepID=A0A132B8E1_MOLSC|nr:uncharacterized protein LY89DRAFT_659304 [Mollisia scopiformis]KUJ08259.1 hypothetical protein LY89DRAFT_659304 [Mollisia scopiformis]